MQPLVPFATRQFTSRLRRRVPFLLVCLLALLVLPAAVSRPAGARASAACEAPQFKVVREYIRFPAGNQPQGMTAADFNGDGLLDVAVADRESSDTGGSVSVLLGDAASVFKRPGTSSRISGLKAVASGDFNRDGKVDLTTLTLGGSVSILLGNGDGTFKSPTAFGFGSGPASMLVGDFNADGNSDVAVTASGNQGGGLFVRLGDGAGGSACPPSTPRRAPRGRSRPATLTATTAPTWRR